MEYEYSPISIQGAERLAKPHGKRFLSCLPWLISLTLAVLLVLQFPHQKGFCQAQHDFASGYKTEFDPVKQNIVVEEIEFHLPYIPGNDEPFDPPMYEYVGAPSARLDKAWQKLLFGLNLDLAEEEAITIKDDTFQWNDTYMYYSGIQMYHQLHCVDLSFRRGIYHEHYGKPSRKEMFHIDHCLEYIRLTIQCYGDMTPMLWDWNEHRQELILRPEIHTCRNFERVNQWAYERGSCHPPLGISDHDLRAWKALGGCYWPGGPESL